jgi:hypothetical protein
LRPIRSGKKAGKALAQPVRRKLRTRNRNSRGIATIVAPDGDPDSVNVVMHPSVEGRRLVADAVIAILSVILDGGLMG